MASWLQTRYLVTNCTDADSRLHNNAAAVAAMTTVAEMVVKVTLPHTAKSAGKNKDSSSQE